MGRVVGEPMILVWGRVSPKPLRALNPTGRQYILVLLGGPWDLVTTYNWANSPTYNPPEWAYRGYPNHK